MSYQYGEYTNEAGATAVLQSDPISRARYERKGWTYSGPAKVIPGLEPANPNGEQASDNLDAQAVVQQAADVVMRKITGTWTEAEATAESAVIRGVMADEGSFDIYKANMPVATEEATTAVAPPPAPLEGPPAGAQVSMTGEGGGLPGVPTDGTSTTTTTPTDGASTTPPPTETTEPTTSTGAPANP